MSSGNRPSTLLLLLAALGASACGRSDQGASARPNVLVYLVDTTRADHLSTYGYERETTPRLDAFARDGVVFERAWSPSSWTRAATASLLTGLDPARHGARSRSHKISVEAPLLAEALSEAGYSCASIVTNPHVVETWGFARGFEVFEDLGALTPNWQDADAARVIARVEELLDGFAADPRPFFLYVHTIDPHGPNTPPEPYDTLFTDDPRTPPLPGALTPETPPEDLENMLALYDAEIRFADEYFGRLLDGLESRGMLDDTLIVFTSDHGEEHLEHGRGGHGQQLFEEVVRVPLVMRFPGGWRSGSRVRERASLLDVVPTVFSGVGLPVPEGLDGVDLRPAVQGLAKADWEQRPFFLDLDLVRHDGELHRAEGILKGRWKYISEEEPLRRRYLFDLESDPGETANLLGEHPDVAEELQAILAAYRGSRDAGVHLRLASAKDGENPTKVRVLLRFHGGNVRDVRGLELEDEDSYAIDPFSKTIELLLMLREEPRAGGKRQRLKQDVDEIVIRLDSPDGSLVIEAMEGVPGPLVAQGKVVPEVSWPLTIPATSTEWAAPERNPNIRRLDPGLVIWVQPPPEALDAVPEELRQRFEELGYGGDF